MSLNERKKKILKAVIEDYINYAEPIGSRHIAKNHDISLSSATIRNELADLEDLGYLVKTHTSSGRVPSDLGYRTYVDTLIEKYIVSMQEIGSLKAQMQQKVRDLDFYIKQVLNICSNHTNLTAVALTPDYTKGTIKNIDFLMLDKSNIMLILVTDTNVVKSKHIHLKMEVDLEFILSLKDELNEYISGHTIEEIIRTSFEELTLKLRGDHGAVVEILEFVYSTISEINENEIYLSGETNMLSLPEFKDVKKAKDFLELVHDKAKMKDILVSNLKDDVLKVVIGDESASSDTKGLSMVLSTYKISDSVFGAIGIIGPTRMDYTKAISSLDYITNSLNEALDDKSGKE
ncbi:MAG: heat-inducible transcription repressor HrcA [Ruminococcaceae bacterium]|nr:heat-inducible transcription repressor HrcA [Oscillospiraceae bacterium]